MPMFDQNKKITQVIMAKMKPGKSEEMESAPENEMGDQMDNSMALESAAEEVMSAIESKNVPGLVEAMKSLIEMCMDEYESSESEAE